jgi:hypothetical protein
LVPRTVRIHWQKNKLVKHFSIAGDEYRFQNGSTLAAANLPTEFNQPTPARSSGFAVFMRNDNSVVEPERF